MSKLVYLSQPSRLGGAGNEIYRGQVIEALLERDINVVHPFEAFPYVRFEGHPKVGRELAMKYCCDLINACSGGMALTGISEGTLIETIYLLEHYPDRELIVLPEFDPLWSDEAARLARQEKFAPIIGKLAMLNKDDI